MLGNKKIFLVGTILSFVLLFLTPSKLFFPLPFILFFLVAFFYFKEIKKAIFLSIVFSLPYLPGFSLLVIDNINLFSISPFVGFVLLSSLFSFKKSIRYSFSWPMIYLFSFIIWNVFSFIVINTFPEVLDGLYEIIIGFLLYYLAREYLKEEVLRDSIVFIIASILIFESMVTLLQFISGHPLGRFIEAGITSLPYGKVASENIALYRPSGTMYGPTWLSRLINMLLPFVLLNTKLIFPLSKKGRLVIVALASLAVFVSFTRVSWIVLLLIILYVFFRKKKEMNLALVIRPAHFFLIGLFSFFFIFFSFPYFYQRWVTTSISFEEKGSFGLRVKLFSEAINVLEQYPIFGVGLNSYVIVASAENITGVYNYSKEQVHNLLMLIACETGIPGVLFFIGFIVSSYSYYLIKRKSIKDFELQKFKDAAAIGGLVFLAETMLNITFLAPHYYLFHLFMAILTS